MNRGWIELDGSPAADGGQVLRSALTLSLMTGRPFRLVNIRAGQNPPGLRPPDVACIRAAATISGARYKGAVVGSHVLSFEPKPVRPGHYRFDLGSAGPITLVLQTVALPLAWRASQPSEVELSGGTHVEQAPCFHFLAVTWAAYLRRIGLDLDLHLTHPGFSSGGEGKVCMTVRPCSLLRGLNLMTCPTLTTAVGLSASAGLPASVGRRQAERLSTRLKVAGITPHVVTEQWVADGPGTLATVVFRQTPVPTLFSGLGAPGKPAEAVADEAADQALRFRATGCPVDPDSARLLLLPLMFSPDASTYRTSEVTPRLTTELGIVRRFVKREVTVDSVPGAPGLMRIAAERGV